MKDEAENKLWNPAPRMEQNRNDKAISITRDITCLNCGRKGLMDIHDEREGVAEGRLFRHLGHNPFSGDLHYQCPACRIVLLVDPTLALGEQPIKGRPHLLTVKQTAEEKGFRQRLINSLRALVFPEGSEEFHYQAHFSGKK
ncbi:MAG: hypothetical protein CVU52_03525 [Deltaproteobacteria bacterium HGW-Deltaproteobacteria-10]|nr:MAG: hypothetical protein CVU52_03525 [Deltaproteobacteria bacterium HGW-Deltaproteobacteria-10]